MNALSCSIRKMLALCAVLVFATLAHAQIDYTKGIYFKQNLGSQVPLDTELRNEDGKTIHLGDVLDGRPVILVPIAFRCQAACPMVTEGLLKTLAAMTRIPKARIGESHNLVVGRDMDVVFVSIDPLDDDPSAVKNGTPTPITDEGAVPLKNSGHVALDKRNLVIGTYAQPGSEHGWHFLTGTFDNIQRVTKAIGMGYYFNAGTDVLRNLTGIVFLSPQGKISSYILGTDYAASVLTDDLKTAAVDGVGQPTENIQFVCFTPDPETGRRRILFEGIVRVVCLLSLVGVISMIVILSLPDWRKPKDGTTQTTQKI